VEEEGQMTPIEEVSEVKSEIENSYADGAYEGMDEEEPGAGVSKFKKDEDMSLAKSEFIQSENLNINSKIKGKPPNELSKQKKGQPQVNDKGRPNTAKPANRPSAKQEPKVKKSLKPQ
jgi:hypothetical protein